MCATALDPAIGVLGGEHFVGADLHARRRLPCRLIGTGLLLRASQVWIPFIATPLEWLAVGVPGPAPIGLRGCRRSSPSAGQRGLPASGRPPPHSHSPGPRRCCPASQRSPICQEATRPPPGRWRQSGRALLSHLCHPRLPPPAWRAPQSVAVRRRAALVCPTDPDPTHRRAASGPMTPPQTVRGRPACIALDAHHRPVATCSCSTPSASSRGPSPCTVGRRSPSPRARPCGPGPSS